MCLSSREEHELSERLRDLACPESDRLDSHVREMHLAAVSRLRARALRHAFGQACCGVLALSVVLGLATAAFVDWDRRDRGTCYLSPADVECVYQPNAKFWFMWNEDGRVVFDNHAVVAPRKIQACTEFYAGEFASNASCLGAVARLGQGPVPCELTMNGGACTNVYDGNAWLVAGLAVTLFSALTVCLAVCINARDFSVGVDQRLAGLRGGPRREVEVEVDFVLDS